MEEVNELLELAMLYDFYGELLKEHNKTFLCRRLRMRKGLRDRESMIW